MLSICEKSQFSKIGKMGIIYIKTTDILFQHTIPYAQSHALHEKYGWQLLYHGEGLLLFLGLFLRITTALTADAGHVTCL